MTADGWKGLQDGPRAWWIGQVPTTEQRPLVADTHMLSRDLSTKVPVNTAAQSRGAWLARSWARTC